MFWNIMIKIINFFRYVIPTTIKNIFNLSWLFGDSINYNNILEFPKNYNFADAKYDLLNTIPNTHPLVETINTFINKYHKDKKVIAVSLSGGVDSMVLISILWKLSKKYNFELVTATLDYSVRKESKDECEFVKLFCNKYGIQFNLKTVTGISRKKNENSRTEYEDVSKAIRFDLYKQILLENKIDGVFVAHHYDDITENVFTNFMRGSNILDLAVMHDKNNVNAVNIYRPLLEHPKSDIFSFAHTYKIPYFKNTTPAWSKRGIMREQVFKLLDNMFGKIFRRNLNEMGQKSYKIGKLIDELIIDPFIKEIEFKKYGCWYKIPEKKIDIFWELILVHIFHEMNTNAPSKKAISLITKFINSADDIVYPIKKNFYFVIHNKIVYIIKDYFTEKNEFSYHIKLNENATKLEIKFMDILNGVFEYSIPVSDETLIKIKLTKKNILNKLGIVKTFPKQLLKYFDFPSFNVKDNYTLKNVKKWQNVKVIY